MKVELHKSAYAAHYYDAEIDTMFSDWFVETEQMNNDDFELEMKIWLEVSQRCKPSKIYDHCVNFVFPIGPEQQVWMAQLLNPGWVACGVKQYSHVVPEELISNLAVDQMFQEFLDMDLENQFAIKHFSDEKEAIQWLNLDVKHLPSRRMTTS